MHALPPEQGGPKYPLMVPPASGHGASKRKDKIREPQDKVYVLVRRRSALCVVPFGPLGAVDTGAATQLATRAERAQQGRRSGWEPTARCGAVRV